MSENRFDRGVSMLAWAYNEEDSVESFVRRAVELLDRTCEDYELVLIDDGSTDRTFEIARGLMASMPRLRIIRNDVNMNSGWNTRNAIQAARKEFLFWQTVDWAYDIDRLRDFLEELRRTDVVQGVRKGGRRSDSVSKALISHVNYLVVRILFGLPFGDFQNVTFYPTALIQSCRLEGVSSFVNPECLLKTYWKGARFKEVPIPFLKRERGEAKGTRVRAIVSSIADILTHWWRWIVLGKRDDRGRGEVERLR